MKGENIFLDENQKGATTKDRMGKSSCHKVKSPFKNLIINCPLLSCSPSLCELFAAWQASKAIFQMLCSRCDNYKMHHHRILAFICFP